jgi:hypothetical protein
MVLSSTVIRFSSVDALKNSDSLSSYVLFEYTDSLNNFGALRHCDSLRSIGALRVVTRSDTSL